MDIQRLGVIGAGQMGSGIAQVAAASGREVILNDISEPLVLRGKEGIARQIAKGVDKGQLSPEEAEATLGCIRTSTVLEDMSGVDYVVEAATEKPDLKFQIFRDLDAACPPGVILATNTSSIPIGMIAAQTGRPQEVIGMHFMNPVPRMQLVEVIRALPTSEETFQTTWDLALAFGKTPVQANDYPGFISNRILMPMINEAIYCLYHSVGTAEDIDTVMKLGMNHPMGPLALADLIGLDTCLAIMETLYQGFCDSKYRPCPLLRNYVAAGWLGRKSGRGFFEYPR